jgi:hypothetical protein
LLAQNVIAQVALGRWDEALEQAARLHEQSDDIWAMQALMLVPVVHAARGQKGPLNSLLEPFSRRAEWASLHAPGQLAKAIILRETARLPEAVEIIVPAGLDSIETRAAETALFFAEAVECAVAAGQTEVLEPLLGRIDALGPAERQPLLDAEGERAKALVAVAEADDAAADQWFRRAVDSLREIETPFHLARAQLQYAELLARTGTDPELEVRLREEAVSAFTTLRAGPWLARADAQRSVVPA